MDTIELVPYVRGEPLWPAVRSDPNVYTGTVNILLLEYRYGASDKSDNVSSTGTRILISNIALPL